MVKEDGKSLMSIDISEQENKAIQLNNFYPEYASIYPTE